MVVDADRHCAVEPVVFEIVVGTAALGPPGWVHEAMQPDVADGLVFSLRELVGLLILETMVAGLSEGTVELWDPLSAEPKLLSSRVVVGPVSLIRIE